MSATQKIETLALASLVRDPAIQCRAAGVDEAIAAEYALAIGNGAKMPPIVVFKEGSVFRLADGWHRCRAHEIAGKTEISAEVRAGGEREARLFAVGANASHGARRTKADRWRAVEMLLKDPAWAVWSDREIAKQAAVDPKFVGPVRASLATTVDNPQLSERKGADGKIRKLAKRKPSKQFDATRAAKEATKALAAMAKQWPKDEPTAPLIEAIQAWLGSVQTSTPASKAGAA
jgi:ParB-like chromosome segregation protein Spo0J